MQEQKLADGLEISSDEEVQSRLDLLSIQTSEYILYHQ